jgi:hypothetical protein
VRLLHRRGNSSKVPFLSNRCSSARGDLLLSAFLWYGWSSSSSRGGADELEAMILAERPVPSRRRSVVAQLPTTVPPQDKQEAECIATKLTCRHEAQRNSLRVQRFVRLCYYVPQL